ncbi:MAG: ATP-binding cassette domain-containing protein [Actinomycetaceae bacterium]|nr:ATP-binding cassette domain-containing protein [Actinomycetaceae bacterium]
MLQTHAHVTRADFALDVECDFYPGEVTAIIGPNGAGKTTLIETVAGLLPPSKSQIVSAGTTLQNDAEGVFVPPHARAAALLRQTPLLFPHLTVFENIAFGPKVARRPRTEIKAETEKWLRALTLEDFRERRPHELSGGQAGRVALARALASRPKILLLDEPTAAFDINVARDFRRLLRHHVSGSEIITIMVTHALEDVAEVADRVVILENGHITESGMALECLQRPRSKFLADFSGTNRVLGASVGDYFDVDGLRLQLRSAAPVGARFAAISPSKVHVGRTGQWEAEVVAVAARGRGYAVTLSRPHGLVAQVSWADFADLPLEIGKKVGVTVNAVDVHAYT